MLNLNIPQRAFFSYSFACPRRRIQVDGSLAEWDESCRLPELMGVEGQRSFASLYLSWDEETLYLGLEVKGKSRYKIDPKNYWQGDCLELWIDTRDVKDSHRANRYCHHFYVLPGGRGRDGLSPIARQVSIDRAREQAPPCPEESIQVALKRLKRGYQLELGLPASGLNGYQPREFNRLGFNYALRDAELGLQSWAASRELSADPSTWGTLELL
jgi:hypothetical protein